MKYKAILENQINKISYQKKETSFFKKEAKSLISELKKQNLIAKIGGSLAKGTMIKSNKIPDIDIFVIFKTEKEMKDLEKKLKKLKIKGKLKKIHGSRDYFQILEEKLVFELIPVIETQDPKLAKNVTDVSLFHVNYVSNKINKNPFLADEIKLTKAFAKAQNCYGAEGYIQGFSGYSLELLTIHFGGFLRLLRNLSKCKIIDPEKHFSNKKYILMELNTSKLQSPIILIDPTYKYRNVSAGLNQETFEKFVKVSKDFLKKPSENYFYKKKFSSKNFIQENKATNVKIICLKFKTNRQEGDIAGTKMKKYFRFICRELQRKGQEVLKSEFVYPGKGQTSEGYIAVRSKSQIKIRGPPTKMREQSKKFKMNHKNVFIEKKSYYATENISLKEILNSTKKIENEIDVNLKELNIL